jgi:cell division septal protein FtsQ
VRRRLAAIGLLVVAVAAVYFFLIRDNTVAPDVMVPEAVAVIGGGEDALAVTGKGKVVPWLLLADEPELPQLPLAEPPKGGRLAGPMLQQARVLAAAPVALRPYLANSYYGESGVDVETTSGIELRFGDASRAVQKWKAAAAVLADPEITALDYVNLYSPGRPSYGGSGHELPPPP